MYKPALCCQVLALERWRYDTDCPPDLKKEIHYFQVTQLSQVKFESLEKQEQVDVDNMERDQKFRPDFMITQIDHPDGQTPVVETRDLDTLNRRHGKCRDNSNYSNESAEVTALLNPFTLPIVLAGYVHFLLSRVHVFWD